MTGTTSTNNINSQSSDPNWWNDALNDLTKYNEENVALNNDISTLKSEIAALFTYKKDGKTADYALIVLVAMNLMSSLLQEKDQQIGIFAKNEDILSDLLSGYNHLQTYINDGKGTKTPAEMAKLVSAMGKLVKGVTLLQNIIPALVADGAMNPKSAAQLLSSLSDMTKQFNHSAQVTKIIKVPGYWKKERVWVSGNGWTEGHYKEETVYVPPSSIPTTVTVQVNDWGNPTQMATDLNNLWNSSNGNGTTPPPPPPAELTALLNDLQNSNENVSGDNTSVNSILQEKVSVYNSFQGVDANVLKQIVAQIKGIVANR